MFFIAIGRCPRETDVPAPQQTEKKKDGLSCQVKFSFGPPNSPQSPEERPRAVGRIVLAFFVSPHFAPSTGVGV